MAGWRGRNMGIVFQFFQLLPTLTVVENVMLPMDFCNMYPPRQRQERALHLLEQVDMADHADKLPTAISGGQQQRVAIARCPGQRSAAHRRRRTHRQPRLAHGRRRLSPVRAPGRRGKTIVMVTHDEDLARSVGRAVTIADGQIASDTRRTDPVLAQVHAAPPVPHTASHSTEHPHFVLPSPLGSMGFGAAAAD